MEIFPLQYIFYIIYVYTYTYIYCSLKLLWNVGNNSTDLYRPQQRKQHAQHDQSRDGVFVHHEEKVGLMLRKPRVFNTKVRTGNTGGHPADLFREGPNLLMFLPTLLAMELG